MADASHDPGRGGAVPGRLDAPGPDLGAARNRRLWDQLARVILASAAALAILVSLPLDHDLRGQILQVVGIVLSAGIALSSATLLGNAMAGLMLRAVRNFRTGDFVEVEGRIGRVTERGLIHTEIQNPDRSLTTLPNLWLAIRPVTVTRSSGAIVECEVSLGYDAPRSRVTELLLAAAASVGLTESIVQVRSLNDYSVTYRVAGLLEEVKQLVSRRFELNAAVLDASVPMNMRSPRSNASSSSRASPSRRPTVSRSTASTSPQTCTTAAWRSCLPRS